MSSENPRITKSIKEDILKLTQKYCNDVENSWVNIVYLSFVIGILSAIISNLFIPLFDSNHYFYIAAISGFFASIFLFLGQKYDMQNRKSQTLQALSTYFERIEGENNDPFANAFERLDEDLNH